MGLILIPPQTPEFTGHTLTPGDGATTSPHGVTTSPPRLDHHRTPTLTRRHRLPVLSKVSRPFEAPPRPWLPGHRGVDLEATPGTEIRASMSGIVAFAGNVGGRPVISVDHADGVRTTYDPVLTRLSRGDRIRRGEILGILAPENEATHGPGLGWGAKIGENYIDPLTLLGHAEIRLKPV